MSDYVLSIYLRVIVSFLERWKCDKYVSMGVQQAVASDYEHSVAFFRLFFWAIVRANTRRPMARVIVEFCSNGFAASVCSEAAEFGRNECVQLCEIAL